MRAILIDPESRSVQYIDVPHQTETESLAECHRLVGEDAIDIAKPFGGLREMVIVGDRSALQEPRLPCFRVAGYHWPLYGRAVVMGYNREGATRPTKMTLEELREWIEFQ